jgi:hypothetical protein
VRLFTRLGYDSTNGTLPSRTRQVRARSFALDGRRLVCGAEVFEAHHRSGARREDLRPLPLRIRKARLARQLAHAASARPLVPSRALVAAMELVPADPLLPPRHLVPALPPVPSPAFRTVRTSRRHSWRQLISVRGLAKQTAVMGNPTVRFVLSEPRHSGTSPEV